MKLMLLIIPTIQKIVKAAAMAPSKRMTGPPNGLAMNPIEIPSATAKTPSAICPRNCHRARRSSRSSIAPSAAAAAPPTISAATAWSSRLNGTGRRPVAMLTLRLTAATTMKAAATASPPPRGIGDVLTRRASGRSTTS